MIWEPEPRYVVTIGCEGPVVGHPHKDYVTAVRVRDGMRRPWRMIWRRQHYWVGPYEEDRPEWLRRLRGTDVK